MHQAFCAWLEPINRRLGILVIGLLFGASCSQKPASNQPINSGPFPPNNPPTEAGIELGKALFLEPALSGNGKLSCASCHPPGSQFTTHGMNTNRAIPHLYNLAWATHFFWDGSHENLESLVFRPILDSTEMHGNLEQSIQHLKTNPEWKRKFHAAFQSDTIYSALISRAISQYLRTLEQKTPSEDSLNEDEKKGLVVFNSACETCHSGVHSSDFVIRKSVAAASGPDSGRYQIAKIPADIYAFKTPSLAFVSKTQPYMHDDRFSSLEDVIETYSTLLPNPELKSPENKGFLLQYLKRL